MSCKGFLLCFLLLWVQKKHSWDLYDYRGLQHVAIDCRRAQHSTKILNVSIDVLVVFCCDEGIEGGCLGWLTVACDLCLVRVKIIDLLNGSGSRIHVNWPLWNWMHEVTASYFYTRLCVYDVIIQYMIMYVNVNSLVLWIIQLSPVARARHQYSTRLPGFSETPTIQVRRDGSVVAWGDPVRGGDVTPVLFKLKQGPGSLGGLQVLGSRRNCHGIVSMVIFYLMHYLGLGTWPVACLPQHKCSLPPQRPDAVAWQASKCQNLRLESWPLQLDNVPPMFCHLSGRLLSTKGIGLPSMALPVNMFHVLCTSQMCIVVINHFPLACRKSMPKFVASFFLFLVRICPNTVAFAALLEDNSEPLLKQTVNCSATSGKCSCSRLWDFVRLLPGDWLLLLGNFVWGWQIFMASYRLLHFSLVMLRRRCVCMLKGISGWKKPPQGCWSSVLEVFTGSYLFSFMQLCHLTRS